ncbi:hypothetical protein [Ornithinimicrobium faecis]|uniref:hypothetical protein n=1 Tax=Ornithinimicrobium faecis TaxID=2934158 RepID=UPI002117FEDB|nr:hypothetical protein [Ornithinimicrobium sp. HY1745]
MRVAGEETAVVHGHEPGSAGRLFPRAATAVAVWHLLRVAALWVLIGAALFWAWLTWGDPDPWTAWACGVVAVQFAVPAYSVTGLGQRLGRRSMTRGQLELGWACVLTLTITTTLVAALVLRQVEGTSPPLADLVVSTVFPALVATAGLVTLPRLWHLGTWWGAVVSIALILITLALMAVSVWLVMGAPEWLAPALWIGSVAALTLAAYQFSRVSMANMHAISDSS